MAKSILKTKISELLKVDRKSIEFLIDDNEYIINVNNKPLLYFGTEETHFCCGVLDCGNTNWDADALMKLDEYDRNTLIVDCFNQLYKMIKGQVDDADGDVKKGLLVWTHTNTNILAIALRSENNKEEYPWKFTQEFFNPNSSNTVNYFIANLN